MAVVKTQQQRNNHARSKRNARRKALRLANVLRHQEENRISKRFAAFKQKGKTLYGIAKEQVEHISKRAFVVTKGSHKGESRVPYVKDNQHGLKLNQRQKRKRARWSGRKAA